MAERLPRHGGMVIIGGGECGAHTAFALRERGWAGPVTVIGDEPVLAYERPPLSKASMVSEQWQPVHPYPAGAFADAGIRALTSTRVDRILPAGRTIQIAGRLLGYDRLLLAVGASPRRLPLPHGDGLLYLRTVQDARTIRAALGPGRRIAILGAGFIGLELAAAARTAGSGVVVIEGADRALGRAVPAAVAQEVTALHQAKQVQFRFGTTITAARRTGRQAVLALSTGEREIFDAVIAGIGAVPSTGLAEAAGLATDNGIAADECLRTSDTDIFAAGDCVSFPHRLFGGARIRLEAWRNALDMAATAAGNLLGAAKPHEAIPWFWSDHYDHSLHVAGLSSLATRYITRHRPDGVSIAFGLDDDNRLTCASAFGPGSTAARDIRLAEAMLRAETRPVPAQLADPGVPLKKLLSASPSPADERRAQRA